MPQPVTVPVLSFRDGPKGRTWNPCTRTELSLQKPAFMVSGLAGIARAPE